MATTCPPILPVYAISTTSQRINRLSLTDIFVRSLPKICGQEEEGKLVYFLGYFVNCSSFFKTMKNYQVFVTNSYFCQISAKNLRAWGGGCPPEPAVHGPAPLPSRPSRPWLLRKGRHKRKLSLSLSIHVTFTFHFSIHFCRLYFHLL